MASDGTWRAESGSQGALSRYSFSWHHSPVRGSAWTFRFLRVEYLRSLRRGRQFFILGLPWLNAFRRVELDLASWSPWGHFSASEWTGFKRLAFTSFRTLVCLRICLRTIGRVCLEKHLNKSICLAFLFYIRKIWQGYGSFCFFSYQCKFCSNIWFGFFSNLCILSSVIFYRTSLL